jgi:hypothetical protein
MIRCTECSAPIEYRDQSCWNCKSPLDKHPMYSDIRYRIAFGWPSTVILGIITFGIFFLILVSFFRMVVDPTRAGDFILSIGFGGILIIACLRMTL